jgi:4-hydroxybutyrate CoA-transferase
MSWEEEFKKRIVTPEEAISRVKSGDRVCFVQGNEPQALGLALAARFGDLENVTISVRTPGKDFGWYDPGWEASFLVEIGFPLPIVRQMIAEKRCDIEIGSLGFDYHGESARQADFVLLELSPPDAHGYCSFGASCWTKLSELRGAKFVIAEINKNLIRTYGANHVHVSEIDLFVEHTPSGKAAPGSTDLLGRKNVEAGPVEKAISEFVSTFINDGDTIQIGVGSASEWCARLDTFKGRNDLGWHSEATPKGVIKMMREGQITGKYKTLNKDKHICTACGGGTLEDMQWVTMNPSFELHPAEYVLDVRVIAQHDNMKAINAAVAIDLTGQIGAESIGPRVLSGAGGQTTFAMGAGLAKGGRSITVLPSTASGGKVSRIVPLLETGTIVTVPRIASDTIITEYGVAKLKGLTVRQRAMALIDIAHPDHRAELKKKAMELYWP